MNVIASDFDNTLFKRNLGLIRETVNYLESKALPVWIVTYRAEDQLEFIESQLAQTNIAVAGYGFAGSRKKDPRTKIALYEQIMLHNTIVEALDDDADVVLELQRMGIDARTT